MNIRYMMNIQYLVNVVKDATHFECSIRFEHSILDERDRLFYFFGGVLSQHGTAVYAQACAQAVPRLVAMIGAVDARSVENINPTENAISAVTKILKYNSSAIQVDDVLAHWITWLPVWEDEVCPFSFSTVHLHLSAVFFLLHPTTLTEFRREQVRRQPSQV